MSMRTTNQPDFASGLAFLAIGIGFATASSRYEFGSAAQMGPAQFPTLVASLLAVFGLVIAGRSLTAATAPGERIDPISIKPIVLVLGSVCLFGVMLMPLGLLLASAALVLVAALASHEFGWRYALASALVLTLGCYAIFILALGLPMPVLPGGF